MNQLERERHCPLRAVGRYGGHLGAVVAHAEVPAGQHSGVALVHQANHAQPLLVLLQRSLGLRHRNTDQFIDTLGNVN